MLCQVLSINWLIVQTMRSQVPNSGQESGPSEVKKSVFDRLGRQLDTGRSMNRRSPYGDHLPPPPPPQMNDTDFGGRFGRDPHLDLEWCYQNERRHMAFGRDRHPPQLAPPPPPPPHYEMDMVSRQPPYYPSSHPYHNVQPGPPGPPIGPGGMPIGMHQRKPSPKYDRHGNVIRSGPMRMNHGPGMSPPRTFVPPGSMIHPGPYDMPPMRPGGGGGGNMYSHHRWHDHLEMGPLPHGPSCILPNDQFMEPHRFQSPQQQQPPPMVNLESEGPLGQHGFGAPRYTKWRERRDVITSLDRETAQSSSRTDSLKSSLQQPDHRVLLKKDVIDYRDSKQAIGEQSLSSSSPSANTTKRPVKREPESGNSAAPNGNTESSGESKKNPKTQRPEPQDISDGEIVDDEDSSDESDIERMAQKGNIHDNFAINSSKCLSTPFARGRENQQHNYEPNKRRRVHDREECSMDYETISDEELDVFMSEKILDDAKLAGNSHGVSSGKSSSEIELLNALGLDWANLVEMSGQSKKEATTSGSALRRFSIPNYLPTLGISPNLAGPELYDLILKICH